MVREAPERPVPRFVPFSFPLKHREHRGDARVAFQQAWLEPDTERALCKILFVAGSRKP